MAMDIDIVGGVSGNKAEVTAANFLKTITETNTTNSGNIGAVKILAESDGGYATGVPYLLSAEVDADYRMRVSQDLLLDDELFAYTAQNTSKHNYLTTTLTNSWSTSQMLTNSGSTTAAGSGTILRTYASFPFLGTQTLSADFEMAFNAQPQTFSFIEFGFMEAASQAVAPADGVFFRLSAAGLQGITSNNGTETSTGVFPAANGTGVWTYTNDKKYQFILYASATEAHFWVNDGVNGAYQLGAITLPTAQGRLSIQPAVSLAIKHRITGGTASGVLQAKFNAYSIRLGGSNASTTLATQGSRLFGAQQNITAPYGSIARFGTITTGNEANATPAVPTTTTAALGSGLGGKFWETASAAINTDLIIMSYQVPVLSIVGMNKRLVLRGMYLTSYVQAAITGGPYTAEWFLAFGHTAVSLATTEAAASKAPRRQSLPFTQQVTVAQAANTTVAQSTTFIDFSDAPIFVNPGEFIQLCKRKIGTVDTAGTFVHVITPVFGWE